jgi:hypothetical protein
MDTARLRKQVYTLFLSDLEQNPIWTYALDEESKVACHGPRRSPCRSPRLCPTLCRGVRPWSHRVPADAPPDRKIDGFGSPATEFSCRFLPAC